MAEANAVLVGRRPIMSYVLSCITLLQGGATEVYIKARGRAISRAIDVIEIVRRRFMQDVKVKEIKIGTEQITSEQSNAPVNVSIIEITLTK